MDMNSRIGTWALAFLLATAAPALAQDWKSSASYPNRAVKIVVPFPAGGPVDLVTRTLGHRLTESWDQPVVIENRPGGNSSVGALAVARAEPDGYTLLMAMDTTLVYNPLTVENLSYNAKDFVPISMVANNTPLIIVPATGRRTTQDLLAQAKEAPGKLNYGVRSFAPSLSRLRVQQNGRDQLHRDRLPGQRRKRARPAQRQRPVYVRWAVREPGPDP